MLSVVCSLASEDSFEKLQLQYVMQITAWDAGHGEELLQAEYSACRTGRTSRLE